ncbi:hypothetical protein EI94DRAFT_1746715 [Lactarius quietus]|nr:hypothetical protein EI94DRAFT_1746715 [Lactarius quietus]
MLAFVCGTSLQPPPPIRAETVYVPPNRDTMTHARVLQSLLVVHNLSTAYQAFGLALAV